MLTAKPLLEVLGCVLMAAAAAILLHDLYRLYLQSNLILNDQPRPAAIQPSWASATRPKTCQTHHPVVYSSAESGEATGIVANHVLLS
jgi:hypothetical protein